jgi:hypothetical protein
MVPSLQASWLFFGVARSTRMIQIWALRSRLEKQPTGRCQKGCVENGSAAALLVLRIDSDMRPPTASPARTALPAAHFERNDVTSI